MQTRLSLLRPYSGLGAKYPIASNITQSGDSVYFTGRLRNLSFENGGRVEGKTVASVISKKGTLRLDNVTVTNNKVIAPRIVASNLTSLEKGGQAKTIDIKDCPQAKGPWVVTGLGGKLKAVNSIIGTITLQEGASDIVLENSKIKRLDLRYDDLEAGWQDWAAADFNITLKNSTIEEVFLPVKIARSFTLKLDDSSYVLDKIQLSNTWTKHHEPVKVIARQPGRQLPSKGVTYFDSTPVTRYVL